MPDTAAARLARIVDMVARLSRRRVAGDEGVPLDEVATELGVRPGDVAGDIRTLTTLDDHAGSEWLLSLSAWQQGDRVSVSSAGPFRRPVRLSPEEFVAVQLALAGEPGGDALAARLAGVITAARGAAAKSAEPVALVASPPGHHRDLLAAAVRGCRRLALLYAGEGDIEGRRWTVQPHQLAEVRGRTYVVAWCEDTGDWRHFRLDRVLDALPADGTFERRADFRPIEAPEDVFRSDDAEQVTVRFSPAVARWVRERYGEVEDQEDGGVVVHLPATSVQWLVRKVLEYGDDAEVIGPARYRAAVRRAVAQENAWLM